MSKDSTHITVILDRTGSMEVIRDDTIGGFNAFLEGQKKLEEKATMTLVQFDSQDPYEVMYSFLDIAEAPRLTRKTYVPRASTPLLDAMGRGMNHLESRLAAMDTTDRPEKIVFVVVTDGHENASREFSRADILKMVERHKSRGWQFVFLGADPTGFDEAGDLGVAYASRLKYHKSQRAVAEAYASLDDKLSAYRSGIAHCVSFDSSDRAAQDQEDDPDQ